MRGLVSLAVRRPVAVLMFALALIVFGVVGYSRLSLDLLPDISYPC
ncbi:MAG: efflux RND transporter permease subunit [Planctomycetota bacterium]